MSAVARALAQLDPSPREGASPPAAETDADPMVVGTDADALLDQAALRVGDAALGLSLAERIPIGSLGVLDYALVTSATLRDSMRRVVRHYSTVTQRVRLELVEDGPRAGVVFHRVPGIRHSRHWIEFSFGILAVRMRQTLGVSFAFEKVALQHEAPASTARHAAFFGTPVEFSSPYECIAFDAALLNRPLLTAAASLAELLDLRLREVASDAAEIDPLVVRARRAVADLLDDGEVSLSALADRLAMSRRNLQRTLAATGVSHTELLEQVRRQRALQLLAHGKVSVAEISERLGFRDPSTFFRAYRRWTGTSPKAGRRPAS